MESELGQFMTNNYDQITEKMMSNEKAQQIGACLATLQHAHDRLKSNSDTLISAMKQNAMIAESLEIEKQTKQLFSDTAKITEEVTDRLQNYEVHMITNDETLHLNSSNITGMEKANQVTQSSQNLLLPAAVRSSSPDRERQESPREESLQNIIPIVGQPTGGGDTMVAVLTLMQQQLHQNSEMMRNF